MAKKQFDPNNRQGALFLMEDILRFRKMKKNDRMDLIDAIFAYVCGEDPHEEKLSYAAALVFPDVRDRVDRMEERYQKKRHAGSSPDKPKDGAAERIIKWSKFLPAGGGRDEASVRVKK